MEMEADPQTCVRRRCATEIWSLGPKGVALGIHRLAALASRTGGDIYFVRHPLRCAAAHRCLCICSCSKPPPIRTPIHFIHAYQSSTNHYPMDSRTIPAPVQPRQAEWEARQEQPPIIVLVDPQLLGESPSTAPTQNSSPMNPNLAAHTALNFYPAVHPLPSSRSMAHLSMPGHSQQQVQSDIHRSIQPDAPVLSQRHSTTLRRYHHCIIRGGLSVAQEVRVQTKSHNSEASEAVRGYDAHLHLQLARL